ncbi:primosomal protein N' [Oxobacter pfennigii]|uniref:Replication restart protein PriA n=1 Tax=Oxobacter pfennigii TaxID=36849 RepID=A0A0P8W7E5_9CLOT|nr:primosomal protein N' [Oxobacter pfennigii]KPU43980.1 primosomal protein N' [Oxobacter pfennigii]
MPSFAEVAVQGFLKGDELSLFDYLIPEIYEKKLKIGMRVIVPFGQRRLEGYVVNIKIHTDIPMDKIRPVEYIPDEEEIFSSNQILLSKWISEEYLCSVADSLKLVIPPQMVLKESKTLILNEIDEDTINTLGDNEKRIVKAIIHNGYTIDLNFLKKSFNWKTDTAIKSLLKSGIISLESNMHANIKDKTYETIMISISEAEAKLLLNSLENSNKLKSQRNIIKVLLNKGSIAKKELTDNYGLSISSINTLVKKGILKKEKIKINRDPYEGVNFPQRAKPNLTYEQNAVIGKILSQYKNYEFSAHMIQGVTGSGKTEVYMRLIEHIIKNGRQAIMLVPEISLTPQTIERFKGRFERVAVMHSRLSAGERYDEWMRIKNNEVDVVVGARSAVFSPLKNLGIIIIDEEHEYSYKSDKTPKYHAREVAYKRCQIENAMLVLGSATPSIETYYEALQGKYSLCKMDNRVDNRKMPQIHIADMREEITSGNRTIFSKLLYTSIEEALEKKEQIILFLNRRGFSTFVSCRKCGHVMKCKRCDVSLTYHIDNGMLNCHYCGYTAKSPEVCPSCGSKYIKHFGLGTQKIESEVKKYFPSARVLRMDMDTTARKGAHEKIYQGFKNQQADILIGTQMVSKGLDFPGVTLVGIIAADMTLNIPDYKSCERTFQLITQVSGRAGRGLKEGKVVVQTYNPEHYSIQAAIGNDYSEFYKKEIIIRETFLYPPYSELINIVVASKDEKQAKETMGEIAAKLTDFLRDNPKINILGPSPAPISKVNMFYRWQTIIKGKMDNKLKYNIKSIINSLNIKKGDVRVNIDVNPVSIA